MYIPKWLVYFGSGVMLIILYLLAGILWIAFSKCGINLESKIIHRHKWEVIKCHVLNCKERIITRKCRECGKVRTSSR
jgi:hypothetical protein